MKSARRLISTGKLLATVAGLICWLLVSTGLFAQICTPGAQGTNAVYNSTCYTGGNPGIVWSAAFIDASVFIGTGNNQFPNICSALNFILNPSNGILPATGGVVDARGISGTTALTCADSPWAGIAASPSTILLPADVILIPKSWVLPDGTKIIGEGAGGFEGSSGFAGTTTLQACNNNTGCSNFTGGTMIQMGDSNCPSNGCHSVVVEDLTLDGANVSSVIGISNANAQELSYVNRVNLYRILGTGLTITGNAYNSGPYSNIIYNTGSSTSPGTCAQIAVTPSGSAAGTRGIHGLTCQASSDSGVAILLDSSNNTLEDIRIVGFFDGVRIGSVNTASSNVLRNVYGDTSRPIVTLTPVNVIHIASHASNIAIMGVENAGGSGTYTIQDDLTPATLPDTYIAMYALGGIHNNGHARFTTSPNTTTWAIGNGDLNEGASCSAPGSLYSNTGPSGTTALWLCVQPNGTPPAEWRLIQ